MVIFDETSQAIVTRLKEVRLRLGLTSAMTSRELGLDESTVSAWERGRWLPNKESIEKIQEWLSKVEAQAALIPKLEFVHENLDSARIQTEQLRFLLNAIELNLRSFINGGPQARVVYRDDIDLYDMNYLISVLEALFDEGKFQRWKMFSNYKFQGFKRGEHVRKGKNQSQPGEPT